VPCLRAFGGAQRQGIQQSRTIGKRTVNLFAGKEEIGMEITGIKTYMTREGTGPALCAR